MRSKDVEDGVGSREAFPEEVILLVLADGGQPNLYSRNMKDKESALAKAEMWKVQTITGFLLCFPSDKVACQSRQAQTEQKLDAFCWKIISK